MRKKIFLTGAGGYIGSRFRSLYSDRYTIVDCGADIRDAEAVVRALSDAQCSLVVHLAAKAHIDDCEKEKPLGKRSEVWLVNVEGTKHVVDACKRIGSYCVVFSTECVFDGKDGNYTETDLPNPINWYGETKYRAEQIVLESGIPACVVRSVLTYGSLHHRRDPAGNLLRRMKNNEMIQVVADQELNFTFIDDLLRALAMIIEKKPEGILHYAGSQSLSPYTFAKKVAAARGYPSKRIKALTMKEYFGDLAKLRLRHATLNCKKISRHFSVIPSDADDAIASLQADLHL